MRAAESGDVDGDAEFVLLRWQPAWPTGGMWPERVLRPSHSDGMLEVRLARTQKKVLRGHGWAIGAEGTWVGYWQHWLQHMAFELNLEGMNGSKGRRNPRQGDRKATAEHERQACYSVVRKTV